MNRVRIRGLGSIFVAFGVLQVALKTELLTAIAGRPSSHCETLTPSRLVRRDKLRITLLQVLIIDLLTSSP